MIHRILWIPSSVLALLLGVVLTVSAGATMPDAWITTKTKLALLTTAGVSGMGINVDTVLGRVTLHGTVRSAEEQAKAGDIAQQISGVLGVNNLLQVVAASDERRGQVADDALAEHITQVLQADASLQDSQIVVQSVHEGVVLLAGTARTLSDHLHAVALVAGIPGVQQVASEIQSPVTLTDTEIWREPAPQQPGAMAGVGIAVRDLWITSATKMRLLADSRTPALDINVDTQAGVVTLFGMVPSQEARSAAEADAYAVRGVHRVVNDLQVVARAEQAAVQARDEELAQAVQTALATPALTYVTVAVHNGVVRLTGTVPSGAQRLEAAVVARAVPGVRAVQDDLRLATATP